MPDDEEKIVENGKGRIIGMLHEMFEGEGEQKGSKARYY